MGYTPPYEITDEIVCLISSVSEKVGSLSDYKGWINKPHLRRVNRIRSVYSSLRIEANPLSLREVSDVINGKTVIGPMKEI
ncbi:MAG: Fic family protein, partial [Erysipelotrichaceae bacterium]|nr:Fic family protein [Erysipelotrichaceae bacterium]